MADFVYNPAESIKQSFQQAGAGIGNIFTQVIAQQQRDYNLAESAFQNIEALKKDVNIFGQKTITSKSNDLLKQAGSAILKDGKLDYSKLGEIRQSISDIKDLKAGYDVGAKEYERMLQLGIANKDNLVSFEKFYKDLSSKMADENLVKNPQDLQKAMADSYTDNLDATKMFGKGYLNTNPYQKISKDVLDPKTGALVRLQGELPTGWTIDAQGNKIPPPPKTVVIDGKSVTMDYVDQEVARLKSTNPEMLDLMKKQAGFAGQTISERDLVKSYIDRVPATVMPTQLKNADELRGQKATADLAEFKAKKAPEEFAINKRVSEAQIAAYGRRGQGDGSELNPQSLDDLSINVNDKGKSVIFGGDGIKIDVPVNKLGSTYTGNPNQAAPFKAINIRTLANGKKQVGGYKLDMEGKVTGELYYIDFDPKDKQIQGSLNSAINRMDKNDKQYIKTQLAVYDRIGIAPQQQAQNKMTDADILATKPAGTQGTDAQYIAAFKALNKIK